MAALRPDGVANGHVEPDQRKILDAPVHMGSLVASSETAKEVDSIWIQKIEDNLVYKFEIV